MITIQPIDVTTVITANIWFIILSIIIGMFVGSSQKKAVYVLFSGFIGSLFAFVLIRCAWELSKVNLAYTLATVIISVGLSIYWAKEKK